MKTIQYLYMYMYTSSTDPETDIYSLHSLKSLGIQK